MKQRNFSLSSAAPLVLSLLFAAQPASVWASCAESTAQCVRLKGGKVVKEGACETFECGSAGSGSGFGARFPDEKTGEDIGWGRERKGMYSWYSCTDEEDDKTKCANDGDFLDGKPATQQGKPVKGKGWMCYEKTGTDEVMCVQGDAASDAASAQGEALSARRT